MEGYYNRQNVVDMRRFRYEECIVRKMYCENTNIQ